MDKIIFFHNRNDFTGSTRVLANMIESEYAKHTATVVTINTGMGFLSALSNVRLVSICYPRVKGKKIPVLTDCIWQLHAWWLAFSCGWLYDTFYLNTVIPYYAAIVGRMYRKRVIYHIHEKYVTKSLKVKTIEFVLNHVRAKRIFVSEYVKKQYPEKTGCEAVVKYNTLPQSFLAKVEPTPIEMRGRHVAIMIASLTKVKGIFTYIEVARRIPEYTFRLMLSADIESIKAFLNCELPENLELIPVQSNIHPYLKTSDMIMNLSIPFFWIETFGMTILEAMPYGIPAIVPNVGGPTEIVEDGYNGYCIDVTDVDKVVATVIKVLDIEEYERLAKNTFDRLKFFI